MKIGGIKSKHGNGVYVDIDDATAAKVVDKVVDTASSAVNGMVAAVILKRVLNTVSSPERQAKLKSQLKKAREEKAEEDAEKAVLLVGLFLLGILALSVYAVVSYLGRYPATDSSVECHGIAKQEQASPGQDKYPQFSKVFPGKNPENFSGTGADSIDGKLVFFSVQNPIRKDAPYIDCRGRDSSGRVGGPQGVNVTDCRICQPKQK
ncbi:MAG: hypothetical protein WC641_02975 [Patescibacteria group bacterium]